MDLIRRSLIAASITDSLTAIMLRRTTKAKATLFHAHPRRLASASPEAEYVARAPWWVVEVLQSTYARSLELTRPA